MSEVVLVVDDDPVQRRLLEGMVGRFGYRTMVAEGGDAAVKMLTDPGARGIDAIVLDLLMPDLDGLGVLARMREAALIIPVIVQTAHGGVDNVVSAIRAGATDFVVKPASAERLQISLQNALTTKALADELQRLKRGPDGTLTIADSFPTQPSIEPPPALTWPEPDGGTASIPLHSVPLTDPRGDVRPLEDIERDAIRFALSGADV